MEEKINTGTILIKEGAVLPECLQLESEPYLKGWSLVKNVDAKELVRIPMMVMGDSDRIVMGVSDA
jgi:hypothetical protein